MTEMNGIARSDLERLSAFLDGELSPAEAEKLEARLATDEQLRGTLEALRATAEALRTLPEVRPPRSFALTDEMVRPRRTYPILQLGTALAALGFVLVVGADLLMSGAAGRSMEIPEQALFAADQLAEPQAAAPAPAEAPALEGEIMEEAESEMAAPAPAEAPASEGEILEEAESEIAEPEAPAAEDADLAQGFLRYGEAAAGETLAEEGEIGREAVAEEEAADEGAFKADAEQEPMIEEQILEEVDLTQARPRVAIGLLRVIEIGLAAAVIVLAGLTLWIRQRG